MTKRTTEQLYDDICMGYSSIRSSTTWKHYKGGYYRTTDENTFSINTTTGELMVNYHRFDGPDFNLTLEMNIPYSRPYSEWFDKVEVDGVMVPRFVRVKKVQVWTEVD